MQELIKQLNHRLFKTFIPPRVLLGRFRFLEESSRTSHASLDRTYLPFYFHLGRVFPTDSMVEMGFGIGLCSGFYLLGNPNIKTFLGFQQKTDEFYSLRVGKHNNRNVCQGERYFHFGFPHDKEFADRLQSRKWGLAISEEKVAYDDHTLRLNTLWDSLQDGGLLVVDYLDGHKPLKKAFDDLCKVKRREPAMIKTRYGIGIMQK